MQDVTITFTGGPLSGGVFEFEVGRVPIGRQPGPGGLELKSADAAVSRTHAELEELEGGVELRNLSPNGTLVDGKLVLDTVRIEPGAEIAIGSGHIFTVAWVSFVSERESETGQGETVEASAPGPLASPVTRAVIAVYLLGMVVVVLWLAGRGSEGGVATDDWPDLQEAYEAYQPAQISAGLRAERLARAEILLREVRTLKTRDMDDEVAPVCRQIMNLDSDIRSPLFQYGVQCLADAKSKGI